MKKIITLTALLPIVMLLFAPILWSGCAFNDVIKNKFPSAQEVIEEMSAGFNIGNVFDNGINSTDPSTIFPIIDLYAEAGMKHVRIPVTWGEGRNAIANEIGRIDTTHVNFLRLKLVIDYALAKGLYVIVNTHHEHWLKDYYDGSLALDYRFATIWAEIAKSFHHYDHHLIFEVLNEPEGMLGEDKNGYPSPEDSLSLAYTRHVNNIGYKAIRSTGGNNSFRVIMVSTNAQGNARMLKKVYSEKSLLPGKGTDRFLAIQVHSYDPWSFCGQTGSNSKYPGKESIEMAIDPIVKHAKYLGVPIHYGEFGVGRDSNQSDRDSEIVREYYKSFAQKVLREKMSYAVWDDRGWFGLVKKDDFNKYSFQFDIVPTMLK